MGGTGQHKRYPLPGGGWLVGDVFVGVELKAGTWRMGRNKTALFFRSLGAELSSGSYGPGRIPRAVVVREGSSTGRELYRQGPYSDISVQRPLEAILTELENDGSKAFLTNGAPRHGRLGPIRAASATKVNLPAVALRHYWYRVRRPHHRRAE